MKKMAERKIDGHQKNLERLLSSLEAGSAKEQVEQAMEGHILAQTRLTGLFGS